MHDRGTARHPPRSDDGWLIVVDGHIVVVALEQPHNSTIQDIDCGYHEHQVATNVAL